MSPFQPARITHDGQTYVLTLDELHTLDGHPADWHGPGDPSTWLAVRTFAHAKSRYADAPKTVALALASQALGISDDKLIALIEWNEGYCRMKDGDDGSPSILDY